MVATAANTEDEAGNDLTERAARQRRTPEAQRAAILEAAQTVFLEYGYAGTSVDAVVKRAGGSKATVYAQFGSKEGLFSAVVARGAERIATAIQSINICESLEESLKTVGRAYLQMVLDPKRVALIRLVSGESGQRPEIGDIFYRLGPQAGLKLMTEFLRRCIACGMFQADDPEALADCFIHGLLGDLFFRAVFNPTRLSLASEIDQHVDKVVELFIHGVKHPPSSRDQSSADLA